MTHTIMTKKIGHLEYWPHCAAPKCVEEDRYGEGGRKDWSGEEQKEGREREGSEEVGEQKILSRR